MYPSDTDSLFGVFVKNFREKLSEEGVLFPAVSVIKGKRSNKRAKAAAYSAYYSAVIRNYVRSDFDLMYVHYLSHNTPILLFLLSTFGKKKKWVINVHGNDIIDSVDKKIEKLNAKVLARTDLLVVPSLYFKEIVLKRYPLLSEAIIFVSPSGGIDAKRFYPIEKKENSIPVLGLISRIDEGKGWDKFLLSLSQLKKQNIPFSAVIAGQGLQEEKLKNLMKQLHLENEVDFHGLVHQDKLVHLYNNMDLMVFPTEREAESLGLVGLEAMSCGTPVLGSNMAGPQTYIKDGENGFLFEPGNVASLTEGIKKYLALSPTSKEAMRVQALKTAKSYEANTVIHKLHKRLNTLCSEK